MPVVEVIPLNPKPPPAPNTAVVVATTLAAFAMSQEDRWRSWLNNAEALRDSHPDVRFFCAIEVDARGLDPFALLLDRLTDLGGDYWSFSLDDGRTRVTTANRLRHITTGQNLVADYCSTPGISHLLFLAADCTPPPDAIPKLLEVDHGIVGGHVATYCLFGDRVDGYPESWDVQAHMASAAFMLIRRDVFKRLRWRWDAEAGLSDDPAYHFDAMDLLEVPTYVRHTVVGRHYPESIGAVETRFSVEAMEVHRSVDVTADRPEQSDVRSTNSP